MREERAIGRPRGFDADAALRTIMELFWRRGYDATSLADIVEATGLKKGSLYAAFGDKRAMYSKALARYEALTRADIEASLGGSGDPRARLRAFLSAPIEAARRAGDRRGCFLCNAATDQAPVDEEAARLVRRGFDHMAAALDRALAELGSERDAAARWLLAAYLGLRAMARAGVSREALEEARDAALARL